MITAKVICDSINYSKVRLTTLELTYPRFIHSEFMTHRALSKNSASSRAIPLAKMIAAIQKEIASPEYWAKNQSGMQASEALDGLEAKHAELCWHKAAAAAIAYAEQLGKLGTHKAIANRILEPFAHMTVIATGDQFGWANFFALRAHPMAQQEIQALAYRALNATMLSTPDIRKDGEWHLPYSHPTDEGLPVGDRLELCTARCARVSLLNQDGVFNVVDDLKLHARLRDARPVHASAFEHCAQAVACEAMRDPKIGSNFHMTWKQYRKAIPNESTREIDSAAIMATKPDWITL